MKIWLSAKLSVLAGSGGKVTKRGESRPLFFFICGTWASLAGQHFIAHP